MSSVLVAIDYSGVQSHPLGGGKRVFDAVQLTRLLGVVGYLVKSELSCRCPPAGLVES